MALGVVFLLLTNAAEKAIPWLLANALDSLQRAEVEDARNDALVVIGLAAVMWGVRTLSRVWLFNVGRDVEYDVRNDMLARVHVLGPSFFRRMATGEIMSRATNDVAQLRVLVGFAGLNIVNSFVAFVSAIALMLAISPRLTLWALLPFPLLILITRAFSRAMYTRSRDSQEALANLSDRANENVAGIRLVRAMGLEATEHARFAEANERAVATTMALVTLRGLMWPILMGVGSIGTLLVVWIGGGMVLDGEMTAGEFSAFNAYLALLIWPTLALGYILSVVQRGRASFDRVREILEAEPDVRQPEQPRQPDGPGSLEVTGLEFAHGDTQVLDDVTLSVPAGGSLAVLGPTGSGKSTLAALLPRLLPTPPGAVKLDGVDVTELDLRGLRAAVGYAQQEPFLFSTTVERNLKLALEDPTAPDADERIRHAASEACVLEEIEGMNAGMATVIGERGVQLSGGQKQRLALARALLRRPKVLVLDDPLSAVDAATEAQILAALDRAKADRTFVLITNRVAAASRTERIVVLDEGRVVEDGTHDELIANGGLYSRIAARQQLEKELASL
ncbi:MAG: ABC transporter ATP-binding protein [Sandaracinaceae bacterium]|nr:ABC transporter ATP-binding protein [Sandaracinaceae bacterium]